jgi:dodecin
LNSSGGSIRVEVRGKQAEICNISDNSRFRFRAGGYLARVEAMSTHIYKKIELVGSSPNSIEEAVQNAVSKASQSLRNLRWFEVVETRGQIENNRIAHWQVTIKVGFTLED